MTTREAISILKATRPRLIAWGCHVAVSLAKKNNTVHSREVWNEMLKLGCINEEDKAFWLGAVFKTLKEEGLLKWSGHYYKYSDKGRNIHDREVKLWELNIPETQETSYDKCPSE